jgi:NTP pyrophosphatase (non-canonical NTP hydrolase)
MDILIDKIEQWSIDRNLNTADSNRQMLKVMEEVGELSSALAKNNRMEIIDAIGDVVVTLTILSQQHNLHLQDCVEVAYQQIANRTGKTVNGIFIKD